ncbi:hypothetical protein QTN47_19670 [Danxiaibacter flavus]|uniref:Uncharacterized protein n=1 Tax=Danxiaibacter flavus TaxID=3049108 RepID=A0ABV3ZMN3_9BACT|nr:hypothetical protein QNM32_19680 [Chitinophagaceae bacterium DXS]
MKNKKQSKTSKTKRLKGFTVDPALDHKYDNHPFFKEKAEKANAILKVAGLPKL